MVKTNKALYGRFRHLKVFNKKQFEDFKGYMLAFLSDNYITTGKTVINKAAKIKVQFDHEGIKHSLNVGGTIAKTKSLTVLDKIIEQAFLIEIEPDKNVNGRSIAKLFCLVDVDGFIWEARLVLKEKHNGVFLYDHRLSKYKKLNNP